MKSLIFLLGLFFTTVTIAVSTPSAPDLDVKSYHLIDFNSGDVLGTKNADLRLAPASMTKIMTSLIVFRELKGGNLTLEETVRISEKAWRTPGSRMFVEVNKQVSVKDLLYGMLVQSGNDATVALAEHIAGDESTFAQMMNQTAKQLGMANTHFINASGLPDENHYTTARDLATVTRVMIKEAPELYKINAIKSFTFNGITQQNRNKLLWRDQTVDGVKTGHTEDAGYCLTSSAVRDNMRLISVVMGANSLEARNDANQALLNYGYRFYETHLLYKAQQSLAEAKVWKGNVPTIKTGLKDDLYITIPRNQYKSLDASLAINPQLIAPIQSGQTVGQAIIKLHGKTLLKRPLIALSGVEEGSLMQKLKDEALMRLQ